MNRKYLLMSMAFTLLVEGFPLAAQAPTAPAAAPEASADLPVAKPAAKAKASTKAGKKSPTAGTQKQRRQKPKAVDYSKMVELNSASKQQLMTLPGVDATLADKIIAGRPYLSKSNLETHNVLPKGSYQAMRTMVYVVPPVAKAKP